MALTLSDLWGAVARHFGGVHVQSTATGGTTTTVVDTSALAGQFADDYLNNSWVAIITDAGGAHAAPEGQARRVSDFVESSGTITVPVAFSAAVAVGDVYRVWAGVSKSEAIDAVKEALRKAWPAFYAPVIDDTVTIVTNTYEYAQPAAVSFVDEVLIKPSSTSYHYEPVPGWTITESGGTRKLVLDHTGSYQAGTTLRLIGRGPITVPVAEHTALTMDDRFEDALRNYVGMAGAGLCHEWMMGRDSDNERYHYTRASELAGAAARVRRYQAMRAPDGHSRVVYPEYWR